MADAPPMLAIALSALAVVALAYGLVAWVGAERLTRRRPPDPAATPADFGLPFEDIRLAARDGVALGGVWIPPPDGAAGRIGANRGGGHRWHARHPRRPECEREFYEHQVDSR